PSEFTEYPVDIVESPLCGERQRQRVAREPQRQTAVATLAFEALAAESFSVRKATFHQCRVGAERRCNAANGVVLVAQDPKGLDGPSSNLDPLVQDELRNQRR